jgi:hypothetical protein
LAGSFRWRGRSGARAVRGGATGPDSDGNSAAGIRLRRPVRLRVIADAMRAVNRTGVAVDAASRRACNRGGSRTLQRQRCTGRRHFLRQRGQPERSVFRTNGSGQHVPRSAAGVKVGVNKLGEGDAAARAPV